MISKSIRLLRRPDGLPGMSDFELAEEPVPALREGEVLIRQLLMSVDPAMRSLLSHGYSLGQPLTAFALGRVVESRNADFPVGVLVSSRLGFREFAVSDGAGLRVRDIASDIPLSAYLSVLGNTGFTAYGGMLDIARTRPGEQVFVSTAAGAVGSIAAQVARNLECHVVGSTGSDEKADWLRDELGIATVINYRREGIADALRTAMPNGIDVYFDNVGGEHLDAALPLMNELGRIAVCGMISGYNRPGNVAPVNNLAAIIYRRVTLRGFTTVDFTDRLAKFETEMADWVRAGRIRWRDSIVDGLERAPDALIGLFRGDNIGKALVRIASDA